MNITDFLLGFILGSAVFSIIIVFFSSSRKSSGLNNDLESIKSMSSTLIADALRQNSLLNEISIKNASEQAGSALDTKKAEMDGLLTPLRLQIEKFNNTLEEIENKRREDYGSINSFLESVRNATTELSTETVSLRTMLSNSQARGRWGEITLKRIVESAGMIEHVDYEEQLVGDNGQRPDMIINLPHGRKIIVDSKAPYTNYLKSTHATTKSEEDHLLREFSSDLRKQIKILSSKNYDTSIDGAPDFVIMFLPQESILGIALSVDPELTEYSLERSVVLCTPLTLLATLKVIHMSWRQDSLVKNSGEIIKVASTLYERMEGMLKRMSDTSSSVKSLIRNFNSLLSYTDSRVLPSMRRINQLGELKRDEISKLEEINEEFRDL